MGCVFSNTGSQHQGCVIMGCHFLAQVSDKFAFSLFDLDWDVFMQHIEGAVNRVPVLEQTGIKSTVCGPGTHTHTQRAPVPDRVCDLLLCVQNPSRPTTNL